MRWSVEVTFQESKPHWGFEEPQGWSRQTVKRTTPMAMLSYTWTAPMATLLYTWIVHWYAQEGRQQESLPIFAWYPAKSQASFAEMLASLRRARLRERISALGLWGQGSRRIRQLLENLVTLAA
jgi:endonuclease III